MSTNTFFELETLRESVAKKFGGRLSTANDFGELSGVIFEATGHLISESTLKRVWGYVNYTPQARTTTLDILAKYAGHESFRTFCLELQKNSAFFACDKIIAADLTEGDCISIGWAPDREIIIKYLGLSRFQVNDGGKSKLQKGDIIEATEFLKGVPMFFARVLRGNEELPAYVAGKAGGLTKLELISGKNH